MSYHKKNLKEKLVEVAWNICVAESWEKVNMREVAKKARVSNTASSLHKIWIKVSIYLRFNVWEYGFRYISLSRYRSSI